MKRTATVFFVPVADVGELGEYVECQSCGATYEVGVLELAREDEMQDTRSRGLKRLAAAVIGADGEVTRDECIAVLDLLPQHWGVQYRLEELEHDIAMGTDGLLSVLENAGAVTNLDGREAMMNAALYFSAVDGEISKSELAVLVSAGRALGLSSAHIRGIIAEVLEAD